MLLQQLQLQNIRSYVDETITFSKGSTLLSGDIGSGKSTILFAIEFALFGTSRPDLPAELLLRNGAAQGSVELKLNLCGHDVVIKRHLKREKDAIKQLPGHIIINNVKKELMPVELKAEIISLLGYPEELASKNKNYIFRYTLYTPQEEMKLILQENSETRLDVLRKIFNIDRYRVIRDNLERYLKTARTNIAIRTTRIEPLDDQKLRLDLLVGEIKELEKSIKDLHPELYSFQAAIEQQKREIEALEQKQKAFLELRQRYRTTTAIILEKKEREQRLTERKEHLQQEIKQLSLPPGAEASDLRKRLEIIAGQKNSLLKLKVSLEQKIQYLQANMVKLQQELGVLSETVLKLEQKKILQESLSLETSPKESLEQKRKEVESLLQKTRVLIVQNKTLLSQSKGIQETISSLDNCPTCLQAVPSEYKDEIIRQEQQKIGKASYILAEFEAKEAEIITQKEKIEYEAREMVKKENTILTLTVEIRQLGEAKKVMEQKNEAVQGLAEEHTALLEQKNNIKDQSFLEFNRQEAEVQELLRVCAKKEFLEKESCELLSEIAENRKKILNLEAELSSLAGQVTEKEDYTAAIEAKRQEFAETSKKEKEKAIQMAMLRTRHDTLAKQEAEAAETVARLTEEKNKLVRLQETYRWLDEFVMKVTYTIERQVMVHIHAHFNRIFQEWFSILIDDESVYARLDEAFTPVIHQNGYEMSFANLSGGEKTSAALAYRLALNKVINDVISQINTKDILILDEPTDGFSTEQLDKVRDVLERLQLTQTIIVSHESKIESFVENVIRIGKHGHGSRII